MIGLNQTVYSKSYYLPQRGKDMIPLGENNICFHFYGYFKHNVHKIITLRKYKKQKVWQTIKRKRKPNTKNVSKTVQDLALTDKDFFFNINILKKIQQKKKEINEITCKDKKENPRTMFHQINNINQEIESIYKKRPK